MNKSFGLVNGIKNDERHQSLLTEATHFINKKNSFKTFLSFGCFWLHLLSFLFEFRFKIKKKIILHYVPDAFFFLDKFSAVLCHHHRPMKCALN